MVGRYTASAFLLAMVVGACGSVAPGPVSAAAGPTPAATARARTPRPPDAAPSPCLPSAHALAGPLSPVPGLTIADAAYQGAIAADPGPVSPSANVTPALRRSYEQLVRPVLDACMAYRQAAAADPSLESTAYTRIGDLMDLLAMRTQELVAAANSWPIDDRRLERSVCHIYCDAAVAYTRAYEADRTNARATEQLRAYGRYYRGERLRTCSE